MADNLLLLFDRPGEPIFTKKSNQNKLINVPDEYLDERYKQLNEIDSLQNRFGDNQTEKIEVKYIPLPDTTFPEQLSKDARFSLFIPMHQEMADRLIELFLGMHDLDDFWSLAVYSRSKMNAQLFNYALSVAMLHRPETRDLQLPPLNESFPDKFFDTDVMNRIREETSIAVDPAERVSIDVISNYTASDLDVEHRLSYFREDIGVNLHHWHWHLVYPLSGPESVVKKDRRGELFFYMHSQVLARYNMDRMCNQLPRVTRLLNLQDPIPEAYYPKLDNKMSTRNWPGRSSNSVLQDVSRPEEDLYFDIQDLDHWRARILDAIYQGFVIDPNGVQVPLTEKDGIDVLGNLIESSILSINRKFYGNLHNLIHMALSYIHDPDFRHLESYNVLGDSATAMRDPVFYRVHNMVEDIFQKYKSTLTPYTYEELNFSTVKVTNVSVQATGYKKNQLVTYWQKSDVDLSRGVDFSPRGEVLARISHLQHADFTYNIEVTNKGSQRKGTVRLFIAPKFDERGKTIKFREQRRLFIELDRFTVTLKNGSQTITQSSTKSSVTIPFERTFRNLDIERPESGEALAKFNFCGCGWPHHMLLAKGTTEGYPCELFVMISNNADDKVDQEIGPGECTDAMSYCGLRDKLWPDRRAMGFPFDREGRQDSTTLKTFLTPNMKSADVTILHENRVDISKVK